MTTMLYRIALPILSFLLILPSTVVWWLERWRAIAQTRLANLQHARRP
jgi:hypothetical protein